MLGAFVLGLLWELAAHGHPVPAGSNWFTFLLTFDWAAVELEALRTAETMAFITLSLCELFRAYTVRSEQASLFSMGVFSNKYMQYAVGLSLTLLLLATSVPFLQDIFDTHFMSLRELGVVLFFAVIPAVAEEITKFFIRRQK